MVEAMEIQKGFEETEVGVIPSDWDIKEISMFGSVHGRVGWKGYTKKDLRESGPLAIGAKQIDSLHRLDLSAPTYLSMAKFLESPEIMVRKSDILIVQRGNTIGKVVLIDQEIGNATINPSMVILRLMNVSESFVYYYLSSKGGQNQILKDTSSTGVPMITQKQIERFRVPLPPIKAEQTAIATVLNDADALITKLEKLITKKRNIKQGVMQELFKPKKGWGVEKLGLIAVLKKGQLITEKTATLGSVPVIGGGMSTSYYHNEPNRKANTITISASGANAGYVSFHAYPIFASDCTTIENSAEFDVRFLYFTLHLKQKEIYKLQTGGAQPHVYPEQLRNLEICIPKEKEEQTKVAQIFIDMEAEIVALEKKLEKHKIIKQGMMQNLLTGKIRLV